MVSVPLVVEPSEQLGRLTLGFFLDDSMAAQFRDLTGSHVAFASGGQVLASTFPAAARGALAPLMQGPAITRITINGEEFVAERRAIAGQPGRQAGDAAAEPVTLVLRSRTERLRFLSAIQAALGGVLVVTLLVATLVSYGVALTVTRPLAAITYRMREIAATGDLTRKITLPHRGWNDEDARLVATTFNTLTDSVARFQAEAAQRDAVSGAARARELLEEDDAALEAWLDQLAPFQPHAGLDLKALAGKPRAVLRRAVHRWLLLQTKAGKLSRQAFDALLAAAARGVRTRHSLGLQGFAVIRNGSLRFELIGKRRREFQRSTN